MSRSSRALLPASLIALTLLVHRLVPDGSGNTPTSASPSALPKQLQYVLMEQTAAGTLREPLGLALAPDGSVFVADTENHRVQHFSADGAFLTMWGRYGSGEGQFDFPRAVALGPLGTTGTVGVFVLDGEDRIQRFSMAGRYLGVVSAAPLAQDGKPVRIEGMAVSGDGALYVTSAERLMRLSPAGDLDWILQPQAAGEVASGLGPPVVMAEDRVVLCDRTAARIIFVSFGGQQLADWGEKSTSGRSARSVDDPPGQLKNPLKVLPGSSASGQLWVWEPADYKVEWPAVGRIHRFKEDGTWLETQVLLGLSNARDIAIEATGRLRALVDTELLLARTDGTILGRTGAEAEMNLGQPEQIRMAPDGSLYVVQPTQGHQEPDGSYVPIAGLRKEVLHLDTDGRLLAPLGAPNGGANALTQPARIAFEPDGDILLTYSSTQAIHRYSPDGRWESSVQPMTSDGPDSAPLYPGDIAIGQGGGHFVTDGRLHGIAVYDSDWRYLRTLYHPFLHSTNPVLGSEWKPTALALRGSDDIFAIDLANYGSGDYLAGYKSVSHLQSDGTLLNRFGAEGKGDDRLLDARDISSAPDGSLVIADFGNDRVQSFGQNGRWLDRLDLRQAQTGTAGRPISAFWGTDGRLFLANTSPSTVQVYGAQPSETWRVETFDNPWLTGWPEQITYLPNATADWGEEPLAAGLPKDGTSALLSRNLWLAKGRYRVRLQAAGGVKLWLGDHLVQDAWEQNDSDWSDTLVLGGSYFVRLAFRDLDGPASVHLDIERIEAMTEAPTPEATLLVPYTNTPSAKPSVTLAPAARYISAFLPMVGRSFSRGGSDDRPPTPDRSSPTPSSTPSWLTPGKSLAPAYALHPEIDVQAYDVRLVIPRLGDPIRASLALTLTARQALTAIDLDTEPGTVHVTKVSSEGQQLLHRLVPGGAPNGLISGTWLRIHPPRALKAGDRVVLSIDYVITYPVVNDSQAVQGFSMFSWYYGSPLLETLGWPYRTRFWLPSNDHPADPATIKLELHVPPGLVGASVGRLVDGDYRQGSGRDAQGLQVFRWALDQAVPTYGYNVVVGDLDVYHEDVCYDIETINSLRLPCDRASQRVPLVRYAPRGMALEDQYLKQDRDYGIKALILFSSMLGPYEFPKLGLAEQPHPFAMEYPSLIAGSPYINIHELAHSWWGDGVQIETWGDFWISEGFTTYFSSLAVEVLGGERPSFSSREGRLVQDKNWDPGNGDGNPAYVKGAAAIGDLRTRIATLAGLAEEDPKARELFFTVMRAVYQEFRMRSLGSVPLFDFLREQLGAILAASGHPVPAAEIDSQFDEWERSWTSYEVTKIIVESGDKHGEVDVLMGAGSSPLSEPESMAPLAWFGLACSDDAPIQPVQDKVALIERGGCTFADKLSNAAAEGAVGVVLFTDNRATIAPNLALGLTGMIDREPGLKLRDQLLQGEEVKVTFKSTVFDVRGNPLP